MNGSASPTAAPAWCDRAGSAAARGAVSSHAAADPHHPAPADAPAARALAPAATPGAARSDVMAATVSPGATRSGAQRRRVDASRLHFQHGPIDCIVEAEGEAAAVDRAVEVAWTRFQTVLAELVGELPLLRADLSDGAPVAPHGAIARRMVRACRPHAGSGRFITAMAAVAGSVAEELIGCFDHAGIVRASINNGGDIALYLAAGAWFDVGIVVDPGHALRRAGPPPLRTRIDAASPVRGIATSGWRGRSLSLGIADSVSVLAPSASCADALATMIANAVDIDDPRIVRIAARRVRDDSDLGDRLVTCAVPALAPSAVAQALAAGAAQADAHIAAGRAGAVVLCLQGQVRVCAPPGGFATLADSSSPLARPPSSRV